MHSTPRVAALERFYHTYLADQDSAEFIRRVALRYRCGTLERLAKIGPRLTRRAAVLALGFLGAYESNAVLGRALQDEDRGVRTLAETALRNVWCRDGSAEQQRVLESVIRLNAARSFDDAVHRANTLLAEAPDLAEAWNQRAIAYYGLGRYADSIRDCRRTVELNPYHFGAVAGMGQCFLYQGNLLYALESFRRALELNPNLEAIRANVAMLERRLKKQG
ncbi:MAG TPA: tetratricopeptide repeat protein [Pirellulales bacterium]|jgi:tetratricopeptide (TPR) repeat protein|nr:tetratricopeptide repeat protein [Pirellulales bacterium]